MRGRGFKHDPRFWRFDGRPAWLISPKYATSPHCHLVTADPKYVGRWRDAVRHIRSKRPRAFTACRTVRKPSEADRILRPGRVSDLSHERASFDAAQPHTIAERISCCRGAAYAASPPGRAGLYPAGPSPAAA